MRLCFEPSPPVLLNEKVSQISHSRLNGGWRCLWYRGLRAWLAIVFFDNKNFAASRRVSIKQATPVNKNSRQKESPSQVLLPRPPVPPLRRTTPSAASKNSFARNKILPASYKIGAASCKNTPAGNKKTRWQQSDRCCPSMIRSADGLPTVCKSASTYTMEPMKCAFT